jgi:enoyl-CoA hydratase/carnithine racemase
MTVPGDELVARRRQGHILVITMQRETRRNAIDRAMADALDAALNELDDDDQLWVGVLAGRGPVFSAGSDLSSLGDYSTERGGEYGIIRRRRRKTLIAAVEGAALGGGFEIALACDLVIASAAARFGLPEVGVGLVPACAGLFRAPRSLPLNVARELILTGEPMTAERAYSLGLANEVTGPGQALDRAISLAERICANGPIAVRASLEAVNELVSATDELGWEQTARAWSKIEGSEDAREGVSAFFEKRPPHWRGS